MRKLGTCILLASTRLARLSRLLAPSSRASSLEPSLISIAPQLPFGRCRETWRFVAILFGDFG